MARPVSERDQKILADIGRQWEFLGASAVGAISMHSIYFHPDFDPNGNSQNFGIHKEAEFIEHKVREWATAHGLWIPGLGEHVGTMSSYLYPRGTADALIVAGKCHILDWHLDDRMGRDKIATMSAAERARAEAHRDKITVLISSGAKEGAVGPSLQPFAEAVGEICSTSPYEWQCRFLNAWAGHIDAMCRSHSLRDTHRVPDGAEYETVRYATSGMQYTGELVEYTGGNFLAWKYLDNDLREALDRLIHYCGMAGALCNDLLSFEREVLSESCDDNAIVIHMLNHPEHSLLESLQVIAARANAFVASFFNAHAAAASAGALIEDEPRRRSVLSHLDAMRTYFTGCYAWQRDTGRYEQKNPTIRRD